MTSTTLWDDEEGVNIMAAQFISDLITLNDTATQVWSGKPTMQPNNDLFSDLIPANGNSGFASVMMRHNSNLSDPDCGHSHSM
jgi:hypothetical protein